MYRYLLFLPSFFGLISLTLSGQIISDFNDGSNQGWINGGAAPNPTVQLGGPDGPDDQYLRIVADGAGAGGKLVVFNTSNEWTGNLLESFDAIELNAANFSDRDLTIRFVFEGPAGRLSTVTSLDLAANDDSWQSQIFLLEADSLTGSGDFTSVLSNVTKVWLYHGGTSFPGPNIVAQIGIDNVSQLLEISSVSILGPDVFSLNPLAQPAQSGQSALLLKADQSGSFQLDVFDFSGRFIGQSSGLASAGVDQRINLFDLGPGSYVIRFSLTGSFGQSVRTQRLIVR
ncbi:MAG: T9SS type A sorting domain-containing protein [Bacteroidota bacterium]